MRINTDQIDLVGAIRYVNILTNYIKLNECNTSFDLFCDKVTFL